MFIRRSFFLDTLGTVATTMMVTLLGIPTSILIARFLGPEGKGVITLITLVLGQVGLILTLGVEVALIHYAGRGIWSITELAGASMGLAFCTGVIGFVSALLVFLLAFQESIPNFLLTCILLLASIMPLTLGTGFLRGLMRVSGRIIEEGMVGVFGAILNLTLILIALFGGFGVIGVLLGLWISSVSSGIVVVILSYKWEIVGRKSYIFSPLIWKQLVSYGLKVHLGTLLQSLNYRFDMYLVAFFLGTASVGLYSVAVGMAEWLWLLPGVLGTVLMQRVATQSEEEANVMMGPLNRLTSGVLVIGTLVWAVFGVWIIRILYGEAFAPSYYPLLLLLPGIWALGLWKNIMNDLAVRGYPATKSYTAGASAVVTLALDIVLIPRWGIAGAAIASSIAYWTAFCFALWYYCRVTPFRAREVFSPTLKDLSLAFGRMRRGIQEIVAKSL